MFANERPKEATNMTDLELQSQETEALLKTSERPKHKRALAIHIVALCGTAALAGAALASRAGPRDVAVTGLARTGAPADGVGGRSPLRRSIMRRREASAQHLMTPNPAPSPPAHTSNYSPPYD